MLNSLTHFLQRHVWYLKVRMVMIYLNIISNVAFSYFVVDCISFVLFMLLILLLFDFIIINIT